MHVLLCDGTLPDRTTTASLSIVALDMMKVLLLRKLCLQEKGCGHGY